MERSAGVRERDCLKLTGRNGEVAHGLVVCVVTCFGDECLFRRSTTGSILDGKKVMLDRDEGGRKANEV